MPLACSILTRDIVLSAWSMMKGATGVLVGVPNLKAILLAPTVKGVDKRVIPVPKVPISVPVSQLIGGDVLADLGGLGDGQSPHTDGHQCVNYQEEHCPAYSGIQGPGLIQSCVVQAQAGPPLPQQSSRRAPAR